jgi:hypothetical protein
VRNPIDDFILQKLESKGLAFAPTTDRRSLIRRVTYDLTGLPPTPDEVDAFLADKSSKAYDAVVDRLLASPRYGERWARIWLDVARYADTKGYVFVEDRNYPNAYTYRNWVIDAFNSDLPYDKFIECQLAADRLPEVQNSDDKRDLAALGFLNVGRRFLNSQPDIIDDRIDVTMRGFQAFTVECARCHDHKFDPIPTQDYYSLYAVFASSQEATVPISVKSINDPWERHNAEVDKYEAEIRNLVLSQVKRLRDIKANPEQAKTLTPEVMQSLQSLREGLAPDTPELAKLSKAFEPDKVATLSQLNGTLDALKAKAPPTPEFAMSMTDVAHPHDGVIFKRGNPNLHGDPAPRRFLAALSKPGVERPLWTADSGRLELAESIASKSNPLTARVFVNRIWQSHFGTGIVRTASDFGHQGEPPTHPELLDYLATQFMESGWSIKKLQRLIVTSATYRQSSNATPAAFAADPDNRLLSRMYRHRLDLEEMRDSFMSVAGKLDDPQVGGKSVDLWSQPFTGRRAVYGFVERQNLPGIFRTFDFASPDSTNAKRFMTTVPQQALFFMNSPFSVEEASAAANRPTITSSADTAQRIRRLYRELFERLPSASELNIGLSYLGNNPLASVTAPASIWKYGYGVYDSTRHSVATFTPLAIFKDGNYRVGEAFPDPALGYITLGANSGHPGHDANHGVIRRWTAPADMTIRISGSLAHRQPEGDGIHASIVSNRSGLLGEWDVHNRETKTAVKKIEVKKGETIDFVVDPKSSDSYDAFTWSPVIHSLGGPEKWDASHDFGPPNGPALTRLILYTQALMMTNEFMFVD